MRILVYLAVALAPAAAQETAAHLHHLHLNSTDPEAARRFYTSRFESEPGRLGGALDGVWAHKTWLLFQKVAQAPPWELVSPVWHFGWGAEDMKAAYQRQLDRGTRFFTPLTDISDLARVPGFYYAYVDGPDRALIELNTAPHHHFGHLHLFSADPVAAGDWCGKHLGLTRRGSRPPSREPRFYKGFQVGPSASLSVDDVSILIYPVEHARQAYPEHWRGRTQLAGTAGRVVDHVAFSFKDLDQAVERLRRAGIKIRRAMRAGLAGHIRHAFIEGPDHVPIELVEGHAAKE